MKDRAESLATCKRFGGMSVEHMLLDTSIARITVALLEGIMTVATGRPNANTKLASASKKSMNGKCLRNHDCLAAASRTNERLE
jgi:hypothetical protein